MQTAKTGFTLIELLVVVAIIAILAAIAVPNFLAAQTRSKVARARADIRTIVTAVETYRVDNNHYPTYHYSNVPGAALEFHIGGRVPGFGQPDPTWNSRNPITTPIAYITSMPQDPFLSQENGPAEVREYLYVNWNYALQFAVDSPARANVFELARRQYGSYRIHSRGPDRKGPDSGLPYDPSNGTVSAGDITYGPVPGFDHFVYFPSSTSGG